MFETSIVLAFWATSDMEQHKKPQHVTHLFKQDIVV